MLEQFLKSNGFWSKIPGYWSHKLYFVHITDTIVVKDNVDYDKLFETTKDDSIGVIQFLSELLDV